MVRLILLIGSLVVAGIGSVPQAIAGGYVAEVLRFEVSSGYVEVKAGNFWYEPISARPGAELEINVQVQNQKFNDVTALVCSQREFELYRTGQKVRCPGVDRGRGAFRFRASVQSKEPHYLILNNGFSLLLRKKVSYSVFANQPLQPKEKNKLQQGLEGVSAEITAMFEVPEFDLRVEPCGSENARSNFRTGDITICSEMFIKLAIAGKRGALTAITYHEMGHTLLNLWGLPGHDNEETVDEFAVVMLYMDGHQEYAIEFIEWFEKHDSWAEARNIIRYGDRHPISAQRIRNVRRILRDPGPVIARWNRLLYPRMTANGLRKVVQTSPQYADRDLAKRLISEKPVGQSRHQQQPSGRVATPPPQSNWAPPRQQ